MCMLVRYFLSFVVIVVSLLVLFIEGYLVEWLSELKVSPSQNIE